MAADRAALEERLKQGPEGGARGVGEAVGAAEPGDVLALTFMVVFGSYARGDQTAASDLDVYFEAENLFAPFNRVDAARHYQVFGMPSGVLADELRQARDFGQRVVADALVVHDTGAFRRLLIHVTEGITDRL